MPASFLDNFSRENKAKENLQYDDGAFYYFFSAFTLIVLVPLVISVIEQLCSKRHRFVINKEVAPDLLGHDIQAFLEKKEKSSRIDKKLFYKLILAVLLVFAYSQLVTSSDSEERVLKGFDPYDTLEIPQHTNDTEVIKKAFRKLSIKYHPDRNPDDPKAAAKFMMLTKAYECLTDEEKFENWKNTGNPEGAKGGFSIGIAMPSFLLAKENRVPVLIVFFIFILIVVPYIVLSWYSEVSKYDIDGTLVEDKKIFVQLLNENLILKNCPRVLASCLEFEPILSVSNNQKEDMQQLHRDLTDSIGKPVIEQKIIKPHDLYHAYMMGIPINKALVEDTLYILQKTPKLIEAMIFFSLKVPNYRTPQGFKQFGLRCAMTLIDFSQHFYQGLWQGDSPLLQLTCFDKATIDGFIKKKRKLPEFAQLVRESNKKEGPDFPADEKLQAAMKELVEFPNIEVKPEVFVEGESDIRLGDIVTLKVTLTRLNLNHVDQSFKYLKSNRYPYNEKEKWYVFVGDERRNLVLMSEIASSGKKTSEHKFMFPADNIGTFSFKIFVRSNGYLGLDWEADVKFTVQERADKKKYEIHPEDLAVTKEPTLFEQLTTGAKAGNDSDEELEDDEPGHSHGHGHSHNHGHQHGPGCNHGHSHNEEDEWEEEEEIPKNKPTGKSKTE